jgi:diguanylate cyclase (GGDEF)-like protein/PAS domain S-box-containing protein
MCAKDTAEGVGFYAALVAEHSSDSIIVADRAGRVEWCSPSFERLSGYSLAELRGRTPGSVLQGAETDPATVALIREAIASYRPIRTEILNYTKSGAPYWIELAITPVFSADGTLTHFMSVERDVTERRRADAATAEIIARERQNQHERRLFALTSEWLYATKSLDELLMVVRRAMETLIPEAAGQFYLFSESRDTLELAARWGDGADPPDTIDADACWALRRGRAYSYGTRAIEFPCDHGCDADVPYLCIPVIAHGETIGLIHLAFPTFDRKLIPRDTIETFLNQRWELALLCGEQISLATANVRLRQELEKQSARDALTGLWNRRWFTAAARRELARARRTGKPFSLVAIDVDHFKRFNDAHGHDAGDAVLQEVGRALSAQFPDPFHPCRTGGEEFIVVAPGHGREDARAAAEALRAAMPATDIAHAGGRLPPVTLSAGIATFPDDGDTVEELVKTADVRLYRAKAEGRNRVIAGGEEPDGPAPPGAEQVRAAHAPGGRTSVNTSPAGSTAGAAPA